MTQQLPATTTLAIRQGADNPFEDIATALENPGYIILDKPLGELVLASLFSSLDRLDRESFSRAGVGRESDHQINRSVRTDRIHWLEPAIPGLDSWFAWCEQLRLGLNRELFLGLFDYECHFAWYPSGSYYRRHVDAFRGTDNRMVSTILYLNQNWQPGDGGELLLYCPHSDTVLERIEPVFGRMVLFLSEVFPHEVLMAHKSRYSLTGWYRLNNTDSQNLDPAL